MIIHQATFHTLDLYGSVKKIIIKLQMKVIGWSSTPSSEEEQEEEVVVRVGGLGVCVGGCCNSGPLSRSHGLEMIGFPIVEPCVMNHHFIPKSTPIKSGVCLFRRGTRRGVGGGSRSFLS